MFLIKQLQCWIREKGDPNDKPPRDVDENKEDNSEEDNSLNKSCGHCFSFFTDTPLNCRKAIIRDKKYIFCNTECYETWLKYPPHLMMLGKIN